MPFEAAAKFDGPREGWVFKNGDRGTGYYGDSLLEEDFFRKYPCGYVKNAYIPVFMQKKKQSKRSQVQRQEKYCKDFLERKEEPTAEIMEKVLSMADFRRKDKKHGRKKILKDGDDTYEQLVFGASKPYNSNVFGFSTDAADRPHLATLVGKYSTLMCAKMMDPSSSSSSSSS